MSDREYLQFEWDDAKQKSNLRKHGIYIMRDEYDWSDSKPNPYIKYLKKQVTIRLDIPVIEYFKELSAEIGMPYQSLINHYLRECAELKKKPRFEWEAR